MTDPLPTPARILGPAGLLPFVGLALLAALVPDARLLAIPALLTYGALIASFLGAVHWGLALRPRPGEAPAAWPRIALGVLPALLAWATLLLLPMKTGLVVLAVLLLAIAAVETHAARSGLVPTPYLRLRWLLSAGAAVCRLLGAIVA